MSNVTAILRESWQHQDYWLLMAIPHQEPGRQERYRRENRLIFHTQARLIWWGEMASFRAIHFIYGQVIYLTYTPDQYLIRNAQQMSCTNIQLIFCFSSKQLLPTYLRSKGLQGRAERLKLKLHAKKLDRQAKIVGVVSTLLQKGKENTLLWPCLGDFKMSFSIWKAGSLKSK